MAQFDFKIGVGWDVEAPTNIEDIITDAPTILDDQRVPLHGNVRKQALDGTVRRSGRRNVIWRWDHMSQADFNTLLDYVWGDNASQQVSIYTINERGDYLGYNAIAERPVPGEHYQLWVGDAIRDLTINFWDLTIQPFSFDLSFDDSFG